MLISQRIEERLVCERRLEQVSALLFGEGIGGIPAEQLLDVVA
jgi:hypothetical protein